MEKPFEIVRKIKIPNPKPNENTDFCDPCAMTKSTRKPRPGRNPDNPSTTKPLERVYSDLVGPTTHPSLSHSHYFITLLDDYIVFSVMRFLCPKNDAPDALKAMMQEMEQTFQSTVENITLMNRHKIRALRTDGGGEYLSKTMEK